MAKCKEPLRKKIPLVAYENGKRKIIGEAYVSVHYEDLIVTATGTITDEEIAERIWSSSRELRISTNFEE